MFSILLMDTRSHRDLPLTEAKDYNFAIHISDMTRFQVSISLTLPNLRTQMRGKLFLRQVKYQKYLSRRPKKWRHLPLTTHMTIPVTVLRSVCPVSTIPVKLERGTEVSDTTPTMISNCAERGTQVSYIANNPMTKIRNEIRRQKKTIIMSKRKNTSLASYTSRLQARLKTLKSKMKRSTGESQKQKRLPDHIQNFIDEQRTSLEKSKSGMRWSDSTVKIWKMFLYKSPSCYKLLQKTFTLPGRSTLQRKGANLSAVSEFQV